MPMRKYLKPEDRRRQILDSAQILFARKGYAATTINDVMAMAGVSKGGFYHHFDSKESLLEALACRMAKAALKRIQPLLDDPCIDPFARLNNVLREMRAQKTDIDPNLTRAFEALFQPANFMLYDRVRRAISAEIAPVLAAIIAEGVADGVFNVPDPEICVEIILHLNTAAYDCVADLIASRDRGNSEQAMERLYRVMRMQGIAVDRLLGLPDGSITWVEPGTLEAIFGR